MIVVPHKHVVLLNLSSPQRVTNIIPTARNFVFKDRPLVAVPHNVEESRVLRNLGIVVPAPIRYYYNWPMGTPGRVPFEAQVDTAAFLTMHAHAFVLNELGTGKTLASLWAYDYLRSVGVVKRALVVASLSTLERTWADEVFVNFPHLSCSVLHGTRDKRIKLLEQLTDIYVINHDGIKTEGFLEAMAKRPDIDLIIIDEIAQVGRTAGADRYKVLNKIVNKQMPRYVWGMTAKPTPNAPTDAWAQCRLIAPGSVPPYFNRFRDTVMRQVGGGPFPNWIPRDNAVEVVQSVMQPAIRFTRDQCVDLPPCMYDTRTVALSAPQAKAYKEMLSSLHAQIDQGQVLAVNEAVKVGKLLQIACGAVYGVDGSVIELDSVARVELLLEIIEQAAGKVIVFIPFTGAVDKVARDLAIALNPTVFTQKQLSNAPRHDLGMVGIIDGSVSKTARDDVFERFQKSDELRVLVAQPAAMAHGLTLTEANTIVWYSAICSNEIYEQANGRITRPGQKNTQYIIHIEGTPIERRLYERLKTKQKMQGVLLDAVSASGAVL